MGSVGIVDEGAGVWYEFFWVYWLSMVVCGGLLGE